MSPVTSRDRSAAAGQETEHPESTNRSQLAETMKSMEAEGLVHRRWESKSSTYLISTQPRSSGGEGLAEADEGESERL